MDRRSKIIVSVVGIFIVLLTLIGITYAYFLTRVEGNTNDTSISITTANLRIVYDDNDSRIKATNIQPGDKVYKKTFTVSNEGNETVDYEVYLEEVINDFVHHDDLLMFITCESNIEDNTCNGYGNGSILNDIPTFGNSIYPRENSKLITNTISPSGDGVDKEVHTYTLYLKFRDDGDQSDDMGKLLQGHVQIYDPDNVIAISGEISNYQDGYYVTFESELKTSQIKKVKEGDITKYFYKIIGVEPQELPHTLSIKYIDNNGNEQIVANKSIIISKGTTSNVSEDGTSIVMTNATEEVTLNITTIDTTNKILSLNGTDIIENITNSNPYNNNSLAYQIYNNKAIIRKYTKDGDNYIEGEIVTNSEINEFPETISTIADGTNLSDNGLFSSEDDYGRSYIYRGSVLNNYVSFAGFTWRIVRINGDGSVRVILDGTLDKICVEYESDEETCKKYAGGLSGFNELYDDNAYVGYTYGQAGVTEGNGEKTAYDLTHEYTGDKTNINDKTGQSDIKQAVDSFYKNYLLDDYHDYISDTLFCADKSLASASIGEDNTALGYGGNMSYYAASERLGYSWHNSGYLKPILKCIANNASLTEEQKAYSRYTVSGDDINGIKTNDDLIYPIALLSADEAIMAGIVPVSEGLKHQYYLSDSSYINTSFWWTMTPDGYYYDAVFVYGDSLINDGFGGSQDFINFNEPVGVRPVINLSYEKALYDGGVGTSTSPYTVKLANTN